MQGQRLALAFFTVEVCGYDLLYWSWWIRMELRVHLKTKMNGQVAVAIGRNCLKGLESLGLTAN